MAGILEVCVDSLASARAAIAGGADRLELCSALAIGGLTPYAELLKQIRAESDINIRCLMRPRAGDFLYAPEEIAHRLARDGICVRAGYHCAPLAHEALGTLSRGAVRLGFGAFNTVADLDALWKSLKSALC